jgi:uncharacterized protein YcfL
MKKVGTVILILLFLASCNSQENKKDNKTFQELTVEQQIKNFPEHKLSVIVYDGCEYIIYKEEKDENSSFGFMAHKGNCSNPIHQCK